MPGTNIFTLYIISNYFYVEKSHDSNNIVYNYYISILLYCILFFYYIPTRWKQEHFHSLTVYFEYVSTPRNVFVFYNNTRENNKTRVRQLFLFLKKQ